MIKLLNTDNLLYGSNTAIIDNSGGSNYFARGHMAPDADFIYDVEQVFHINYWGQTQKISIEILLTVQGATYYFMNVLPQYQSFNNGNWKSLEIAFRKYADR